jgi:hypothetical protein
MIQQLPRNWAARISKVNNPGKEYESHLITNESQFDFPEDKSTKEVLVLCQRKEGFGDKRNLKYNVRETVVPKLSRIIETFLQEISGSSTSNIKYMVPCVSSDPHDKADFNMALKTRGQTNEMKDFLDNHLNFYDLIVMQTCPVPYMDYKLIADIVKKDGYVICTVIQDDGLHDVIPEHNKKRYMEKFAAINFFPVPHTKDLTFQYKKENKLPNTHT